VRRVPDGVEDASPAPPYFFLGYAHTPEHPWVGRFYRDLCAEIIERTEWPTHLSPGFMDASGIRPGEDWRQAVGGALATCRVLVPLYSRRYFTRIECGREWHAFHSRLLVHRARFGAAVAPVVPALWTPVQERYIPGSVRDVHADFRSVNQTYAEEGLYTLIKNSSYKRIYLKVVKHLAEQVIDAAESRPLTVCTMDDIDLSQNAFQQPPENVPANRMLKIMIAAPTTQRQPADRLMSFYGTIPQSWTPYQPGQPNPIAELAAQIARSHDYEPGIIAVDDGLAGQDWTSPTSGIGVVLVDPWLALDPDCAEQLRRIDELGAGRIGTVLIWNMADPQTVAKAEEIRKALQSAAPRLLGDPSTPVTLGAVRVQSMQEFTAVLPTVLDRALNRYLNHAEARSISGSSGSLPHLFGPGTDPQAISGMGPQATGGTDGD
jgi:FxsC-like protein